jgi:hypothetical protein
VTPGRPVTGKSGTSTPGAGTGVWPFGGRLGTGRLGSGVLSGDRAYQYGSASRPESTLPCTVRSASARSRMSTRLAAAAGSRGTRKSMVAVVTSRFSRAAACRSVW